MSLGRYCKCRYSDGSPGVTGHRDQSHRVWRRLGTWYTLATGRTGAPQHEIWSEQVPHGATVACGNSLWWIWQMGSMGNLYGNLVDHWCLNYLELIGSWGHISIEAEWIPCLLTWWVLTPLNLRSKTIPSPNHGTSVDPSWLKVLKVMALRIITEFMSCFIQNNAMSFFWRIGIIELPIYVATSNFLMVSCTFWDLKLDSRPDIVTFNSTMPSMADECRWMEAIALLQDVKMKQTLGSTWQW